MTSSKTCAFHSCFGKMSFSLTCKYHPNGTVVYFFLASFHPFYFLAQDSANYSQWAKLNFHLFVNKVLFGLKILSMMSTTQILWPAEPKYLLFGPLQKKFVDPCHPAYSSPCIAFYFLLLIFAYSILTLQNAFQMLHILQELASRNAVSFTGQTR